jgi:hypothetical protein
MTEEPTDDEMCESEHIMKMICAEILNREEQIKKLQGGMAVLQILLDRETKKKQGARSFNDRMDQS